MARNACENCSFSWEKGEDPSYEHLGEISEKYIRLAKSAQIEHYGTLLMKHSRSVRIEGILPSDKTISIQSNRTAFYSFANAIELARKKRELEKTFSRGS